MAERGSGANGIVRFGLVGTGGIATQHIEAIRAIDGAQLIAVSSSTAERARATGDRWGVPWTTDREELLSRDDIDVVAVTTPSGFHAEVALAALRHDKHVVVEKPIAMSIADADLLIEEGRRRGRWVAAISQRRFEPAIRRLKEALDASALGRISLIVVESVNYRPQSYYDSPAWRGTIALDGGVLMTQAIHEIDLACWLGGRIRSVAGNAATLGHEMEAPDTATVSLRFASGTLGSVIATTCAAPGFEQEVRVYGDAGHVRIVGEQPVEWEIPGFDPPSEETLDPEISADELAEPTWGTDSIGHTRQYRDLIAAIREGRSPAITAEDGRRAIEVVMAAHESSRIGRAIELDPPNA